MLDVKLDVTFDATRDVSTRLRKDQSIPTIAQSTKKIQYCTKDLKKREEEKDCLGGPK
jgi:hypothetical protein